MIFLTEQMMEKSPSPPENIRVDFLEILTSFPTFIKFIGNSVSGLWEGKSCEDSSWELDTGAASTNKGLFPSFSNQEKIFKERFVFNQEKSLEKGLLLVRRSPIKKRFRISALCSMQPFSYIRRQAIMFLAQARDYERSKEQTKERAHKGTSIFPQNPTRIEDVPFR